MNTKTTNIDATLLKNLIAYSSEAIVFSDMQGIVQFTNIAADELYGYQPEELKGQSVDIFNSHETFNTEEIIREIKKTGGWSGELIQRKKDETTFWAQLSVTLIKNDDGRPLGFGSHSRNINAKKEKELELRESEEKYRRLFQVSQDGIAIHEDGKIIEVNDQICKILGRSAGEIRASSMKDLIHPEDYDSVMKHMKAGYDKPYRHRALHKDGSVLYLMVHGSNFLLKGRRLRVVIVHDATARTLGERKRRAALKEKEVLLSEVYHRTKNNMQVISSLLSLRAHQLKDKELKEAFTEIRNKIQSMGLVHQKLYESKSLSSLNLGDYIHDLSNLLIQSYSTGQKNINVTSKLENIIVTIDTAMSCGLVISELLSNVFKHAFARSQSGKITIQLTQVNKKIMLTFSDNGRGVPDNFDFDTTDSLGLTTVKGIVTRQMGGRINFSSVNGVQYEIEFSDSLKSVRL